MDLDDLEPRNRPPQKKNLDVMSLDELDDYIVELRRKSPESSRRSQRRRSTATVPTRSSNHSACLSQLRTPAERMASAAGRA